MARPPQLPQPPRSAESPDTTAHLVDGQSGVGVSLRRRDGRTWISIRNEFAMVELSVSADANGPRVMIRDAESDAEILLDPLELEAITRLRHSDFGRLILER